MGKQRLIREHFAEEKVLASVLERIKFDGVLPSVRTNRWEVEQQEQPAASSTVIEFSLGQQGLNSLLQMETALFPLFTDDVMGTGCGRGKLYSWWTSLNCQDCREGEDQNLCVSRSV